MLYLNSEIIDLKLKKLQGMLQKTMLAPLFFTNVLVSEKISKIYQILYVIFSNILGCYFRILLFINER